LEGITLKREEETYGNNIFPHLRSMPGEFSELPCIDKTMSPSMLWAILPSRKKLQRWKEKVEG